MKKISLVLLAGASLLGTATAASAQFYYYDGGPSYVDPGPSYGPRYRERYYDDDDDRYYRRDYRRRYRSRNVCPPHYSVQDGICKPYRGY